jgi:hypothetical protein
MVILPDCGCCNVCESVTKSLIASTSVELTLDFADYEFTGTGEIVNQYCGLQDGQSTSCGRLISGGLMSGTASLSKVPGGNAVNATWRHVFSEPCNTQFVRVEVEASWTAYNNTGTINVFAVLRSRGYHYISGGSGYECNSTFMGCSTQKFIDVGYLSVGNSLYCVNGKFDPSGQNLFPQTVATGDLTIASPGCSHGNAANAYAYVKPTGGSATGNPVFSITSMKFIP